VILHFLFRFAGEGNSLAGRSRVAGDECATSSGAQYLQTVGRAKAKHRLHYLRGLCDRVMYLRGGIIENEYTWREFEGISARERAQMGLRILSLEELYETQNTIGNTEPSRI
jgi:hypothetical protein